MLKGPLLKRFGYLVVREFICYKRYNISSWLTQFTIMARVEKPKPRS